MRVFRHTNLIFASNTYILANKDNDSCYVVDPGDSQPVVEWLNLHNMGLSGILLTHAHFDHIYGLNDLLDKFPKTSLFITPSMVSGLFSIKLNTSYYHEKPYVLKEIYSDNFIFLQEGNGQMLWDDENIFVLYTPGHTLDSTSIQIGNLLFSGDSLIPGLKVFRRKNMSDSEAIVRSLEKIYCTFADSIILLPGHGKDILLGESKHQINFNISEDIAGFTEIKTDRSSLQT